MQFYMNKSVHVTWSLSLSSYVLIACACKAFSTYMVLWNHEANGVKKNGTKKLFDYIT